MWCCVPHKIKPAPPLQGSWKVGPPSYVVDHGKCQFGPDWQPVHMVAKTRVSADTILCTFKLPDETKPLGLPTCACILVGLASNTDAVRPYTPVSTNEMIGFFQLLVKVYDKGVLSTAMMSSLKAELLVKHIPQNVKKQYPFGVKHVGMLVGGTGITPMLQALNAILGNDDDTTKVSLVYGNRRRSDILAKDILQNWTDLFPDRLSVQHILSNEPEESSWTGLRGRINQSLIESSMPAKDSDCLIFVCGPPGFYKTVCGDRSSPPEELGGILADLGYSPAQVYKF